MSSIHQDFAHLRIPLDHIRSATNNFTDDYLIGHGACGKVYKGQLLRSGESITIAARRLDGTPGHEDPRFETEITMLAFLKHQNLVTFLGFCDADGEKIIVNKYEVNSSLDKHLSLPSLTWMQRLHICVGAARALSYMDCDKGHNFSVIHRNIKSSKILLDENWGARVCGFGHSIANVATRRHRQILSEPCGTLGYIDPVCTTNRSVTNKSDVYSFGVVLFEVLSGRKAVTEEDGGCEFLAPLAKEHYEAGKLDGIVHPQLKEQMGPQSLAIFSETAYHCLNGERTRRPEMERVVKRLERALELQKNHEQSTTPIERTANRNSNRWKGKNLEHLMIQLNEIKTATNNFDPTYCIGCGAYGTVYKAELDYFDSESSMAVGTNRDEIPKKHGSVAIKRITDRRDGQGEQGFYAEIEMLTGCKHRNIVSLLGFCDESPERILVYEIASNGSLDDYLRNSDNTTTLTWLQRIKMCIDIAEGLKYLHTTIKDRERIIHRDIKSANILLNEKLDAKISDFGLSRFQPESILNTSTIAGTEVYLDPEYLKTGNLKKESDTYSFGVVLFEIMCGRLAYDEIYKDKGLPSIVRQCFNDGTLKEMVDPIVKEETTNIFTMNRGPSQKSLDAFIEIGYQCLAETQSERPKMEHVIQQLKDALKLQEKNEDCLKISLEVIKKATQGFSYRSRIRRDERGLCELFIGEVGCINGHNTIYAKRLARTTHGQHEFLTELEILSDYKHENVIGLVGYCDEMDEKVIVYENASRGRLDRYVKDKSLTWLKRLEICIDIASGLDFLHGTVAKQEVVLHRDFSSANILLNDDWKAKITNFGRSLICPIYQDDNDFHLHLGTFGYLPPEYLGSSNSKENDIYSLGVVLSEMLCGWLAIKDFDDWQSALKQLNERDLNKGRLEKMVFEGIKEQIDPGSLSTYAWVTYLCMQQPGKKRQPSASEVFLQLKKSLELQVDHEVWKAKLPSDYKKLIQMSKFPEIYFRQRKKDIYTMFFKGILLQEGKLWFSLARNGERNEMLSASQFSYRNRRSRKWRSVPESRFPKVAEMLDITNLNIQIKITTQFLSPGVSYGVHLICKFCGPRKSVAKRIYVNLKYKNGNQNLHAYFATWREDEWMMIELFRFYNHKENTDFEVVLEGFSRCYSQSRAIYIEGIEFRAITTQSFKLKHENPEVVMKSSTHCKEMFKRSESYNEGEMLRLVRHMRMKYWRLHDILNFKLSNSESSVQFRLEGAETLDLRKQVVHIKCKVKSEMLSPNAENVCYLVFKLPEKCDRLHWPVIVRDLHHWRMKETGIIYFKTPNQWNLHDSDWVPKKRTDGWMEVIVWKFTSDYEPKSDGFPVNLKLICYEGTMLGLIVCGLEFRAK